METNWSCDVAHLREKGESNYGNAQVMDDVTVLLLPSFKKSNLHYTRDIPPKPVTSGGVHLRDLVL